MVPSVIGKKTAHSLPEAARRDPYCKGQRVKSSVQEKNLVAKDVEVRRTTRLWRSTTMVRHFRGIGNQIVSSFMKLRVSGSIDGKEVSFSPSVTSGDIPPLVGNDHLIPWGCSIHLYPDECRLGIPSRGIDAKLHVTSSNHILVNLADFECMDESDDDVWTSKRGRDSEETGTESDMTEGTEETINDPEEVPAKRSRRGAPRKPRVPRKKPLPACIQLSPALQSELRKFAACSCTRLIGIGS